MPTDLRRLIAGMGDAPAVGPILSPAARDRIGHSARRRPCSGVSARPCRRRIAPTTRENRLTCGSRATRDVPCSKLPMALCASGATHALIKHRLDVGADESE